MRIEDELQWRKLLWSELGGNDSVALGITPTKLRELGIYGGQQGIWVDKKRTKDLTIDGWGIAVSVIHKGNVYADDFDETGVIYHYPNTERPKSRDSGEVEAVKNCHRFNIPVFVIRISHKNNSLRDVFWGKVHFWDDESEVFVILFGDIIQNHLPSISTSNFQVREEAEKRYSVSLGYPRTVSFRLGVFLRYGTTCSVCEINLAELLDAAHLVPKSDSGSDDPQNGIVLCSLHHRALDRGLFVIHPEKLTLIPQKHGPSLERLKITKTKITHLLQLPHRDALEIAWNFWTSKNQYAEK